MLTLLYVLAFLDRGQCYSDVEASILTISGNIGNAKVAGMNKELNLTGGQYNLVSLLQTRIRVLRVIRDLSHVQGLAASPPCTHPASDRTAGPDSIFLPVRRLRGPKQYRPQAYAAVIVDLYSDGLLVSLPHVHNHR